MEERLISLVKTISKDVHDALGVKSHFHCYCFIGSALAMIVNGAAFDDEYDEERYKQKAKSFFQDLDDIDDKQKNSIIEAIGSIRIYNSSNTKAWNQTIEHLQELGALIDEEHIKDDVLGLFYKEFSIYRKKSERGQVFTPPHIAKLIRETIDISETDRVGDFCCGVGALLAEARKVTNQTFGIEYDPEIYVLALLNCLITKAPANIENIDASSDEASEWIKSKGINKVLLNPPYENKYKCIPIVENVLNSVLPGSDVVIILPDKKLEKANKSAIQRILSKHRLTKIVKLPEQTFYGVGATTSLYYFTTGTPQNEQQIWGCNIEDDGFVVVKNRGREDVKNRWNEMALYWINAIKTETEEKYGTAQFINPGEHLSYVLPEKPFVITEEDFINSALNYVLFRYGINRDKFAEAVMMKAITGTNTNVFDFARVVPKAEKIYRYVCPELKNQAKDREGTFLRAANVAFFRQGHYYALDWILDGYDGPRYNVDAWFNYCITQGMKEGNCKFEELEFWFPAEPKKEPEPDWAYMGHYMGQIVNGVESFVQMIMS